MNTQVSEFKERSWWLSRTHGWNENFAMAEQTLINQGIVHPSTYFLPSTSTHVERGATHSHSQCENCRLIPTLQNTKHKTESSVRERTPTVKSSSKCLP